MHTYSFRTILVLLALSLLAGCVTRADTTRPIPLALIAAPQTAHRLVVILPGRADDLAALKKSGVAQAIQDIWPDADVQLAELRMADYRQGQAIPRLHDEVIAPARKRGYAQIWLGGASLGGMGTLLYDTQYPGEIDGLLLFAPYLGERAILDEIAAAGGVAQWNPGPPQPLGPDTWQHELWRHIKTLSNDPARMRHVWLAYGAQDSLRDAIALMVPLLPRDHVLVRPGGHRWSVWTPAMRELLQAASREAAQLP